MCHFDYREYTCGHLKKLDFHQCATYLGTNVKCAVIAREYLTPAPRMCELHMVKPGAGVYARPQQQGGQEGEEQDEQQVEQQDEQQVEQQ